MFEPLSFPEILLANEAATLNFGATLSRVLTPGTIVFLEGNLGAGKTTCLRGILRGLGFSGSVKSPTYTLVEEYDVEWGPLYHFDLYRLQTAEELETIGIREYFGDNAVVVVEWAERGIGVLPKPDINIIFTIDILKNNRTITLKAYTLKGKNMVEKLQK